MKAPLAIAGQDWDVFEQHGRLVFQDGDGLLDLPLPALQGSLTRSTMPAMPSLVMRALER